MNSAPKVNILLVDDRPDKLLALRTVLGDLKENIVTASSGKEALRLLLHQDFAVILLDVNMPEMDGFETAAFIRQRPRSEYTPIIFITGINTTETHVSRGYSLGAVDYIFTPVVPEVLRAKVAAFIDLYKKAAQIKQQSEWLRLEAERRAIQLETSLKFLLNRLNVGVFRLSIKGDFLEANRAFLRLLGINSLEETNLVDLKELYADVDIKAQNGKMGPEVVSNRQLDERDVKLHRRDGSSFWVLLSRAISSDDNQSIFIDGLIEDITQRKQAEEALMNKAEELIRSNSDLEQFAYIASHDLQEPLRAISCFSTLLSERYQNELDQEATGYLGHLVNGAERMHTLINDLLSFSKVRSGSERTLVQTDLDEVLSHVLFNLQTAINESGVTISISPLPKLEGDPVLLRQLFQNLISNAIKFRSAERPTVNVSAVEHPDLWQFSVSDNGIGISPEYHERIFGIFKRLHTRTQYPGTGIGLAFCRKVVDLHQGRIWVESQPGKGSVFRFTLAKNYANSGAEYRTEATAP